ncbi:MAG: hypothetical protein LBT12_05785 [Oscillospiraceae bacterium]|jgi:hypothetical protein|nr:hypothetical protein [Oscillospiraceae bacterium]
MAQAALKYASYAEEAEYYERVKQPVREAPAVVAAPAARIRTAARPRYGISLFAITGFVFIAFLMGLIMLSYAELNSVNVDITGTPGTKYRSKIVGLRDKLAAVNEQEKRLMIEYERVFDIDEIETYAIAELGMVKPTEDGITTIDATPADKAVILGSPNAEQGGFTAFFSSILEYFK